jgi:hypothetical protein
MAIELFYGPQQTFGVPAHAQRWINLLGRVTEATAETHTLHYALNGGARRIVSIGPDGRRLARHGDFNIDIDRAELRPGSNEIEILLATREVKSALVARQTVVIDNVVEPRWALPYRIDWGAQDDVQHAVQIVDGLWRKAPGGLRNTEPDYDRILALGPYTALTDCEFRVPITVNAIHPDGWTNPNSTAPGLGLVHRWTGHTDRPVICSQPHCGFLPSGAQGWYDWGDAGGTLFLMDSRYQFMQRAPEAFKLATGVTHIWRMRLQTRPDGCHYAFSVWPAGQPEPADWMLTGIDAERDPDVNPPTGSLLLVAHHVDVTVGTIEISA